MTGLVAHHARRPMVSLFLRLQTACGWKRGMELQPEVASCSREGAFESAAGTARLAMASG